MLEWGIIIRPAWQSLMINQKNISDMYNLLLARFSIKIYFQKHNLG